MKFYKKEIHDLIKAWFFISLAFAILFSGEIFAFQIVRLTTYFIISALTVGIAFLFHEMMHKVIAQKYNYQAEFRAFDKMLWLALIMSFFGFIIAAPGAVVIHAFNISKERNGKISLAGPLTNLVLALFFLFLLFSIDTTGIFNIFLNFGFRINSFLALFNLIPVMPFDGRKILDWNKGIYIAIMIFALILFFMSF